MIIDVSSLKWDGVLKGHKLPDANSGDKMSLASKSYN